jgi:splicing factor 3B subunit 4
MASASGALRARNQEATLWVGNLDERVDEELLWELFLQAGPLVEVSVPADKVNGRPQGFAFIEFRAEEDAEYGQKIMNMVPLFGRNLRVRRAGEGGSSGAVRVEVGANLFIGNLAPEATEKTLYDTFSAFGSITEAKVQRDLETGASKGFGFVAYDAFESSDAAIEALNGQYLSGRPVVVQYAFRKDARTERHGSAAERTLAAAQRSSSRLQQPHKFFAAAAGVVEGSMPGSAPGALQSRLIGQLQPAAPPMLPPAAILPANMLLASQQLAALALPLPPPLPPAGATGSAEQQQQQQQQPPPLPATASAHSALAMSFVNPERLRQMQGR